MNERRTIDTSTPPAAFRLYLEERSAESADEAAEFVRFARTCERVAIGAVALCVACGFAAGMAHWVAPWVYGR
jgi:hypothetical protein